jgi:methionine synthase II (cobalamin-independent)
MGVKHKPPFRAEHIGSLLRSPELLALSPQCGFASTAPGNPLTAADQEKKLRLVVETARQVWGEA